MGMPWVKLYTDFLDDPKVGFLSDAAQLLFVKLILMAGECDAEGYIANGETPLTQQQIAWRLRIAPESFAAALAELAQAGLVREDDGLILVTNFQKRQDRSQSEKREMWRERKRRQREAQNVTRESRVNHACVSPLEGEKNREREEREEDPIDGADAPSPTGDRPSPPVLSFQEWLTELQGRNKAATMVRMHAQLYPGRDPPDYGRIGAAARRIGSWSLLAKHLWDESSRPPVGDVFDYIERKHKRGGYRSNGSHAEELDEREREAIARAVHT